MNRCEVSDLPEDQCSHCLGQDEEDDGKWETPIAYRFIAQFGSTGDCGHKIKSGDYAAKTVENEFICERCANE